MEEIIICPAIYQENTWFIFRNNGIEVVLKKIENNFNSSVKLTDSEVDYLNKNLK